jgi:hypothetical protein
LFLCKSDKLLWAGFLPALKGWAEQWQGQKKSEITPYCPCGIARNNSDIETE